MKGKAFITHGGLPPVSYAHLLRFYGKRECDARGVPLDWLECRECGGTGRLDVMRDGTWVEGSALYETCPACGGKGSLRALALHVWRYTLTLTAAVRAGSEPLVVGNVPPFQVPRDVRCEGCNHPVSPPTWDGGSAVPRYRALEIAEARASQRWTPGLAFYDRFPPDQVAWFSCDAECDHGGPFRVRPLREANPAYVPASGWTTYKSEAPDVAERVRFGHEAQASWRLVDIRPLDWACDLRLESLAVLCLRCYEERLKG